MPTDAQVLQDVVAALEQIQELRSDRFYVDVQSRIVTVRGRVRDAVQRERVERTLRGIVGMRALVLEVSVATSPKVNTIYSNPMTA